MTFATFAVEELAEDLKIEQSVIAYTELHMGQLRHRRYMQAVERVRMGLQVSPENFFYNAGQWTGAPYVNLNALEFTALTGTAEDLAYGAAAIATPVELINIVGGEVDALNALVPGSETCKLKLAVNADLIEQIEVRDGDTYTVCDAVGDPVSTTTQVIHLSLKSTNKPDFTFRQWHPQSKYLFNRDCNVCTDAVDPTLTAAYQGDNCYILSAAAFEALKTAVDGIT